MLTQSLQAKGEKKGCTLFYTTVHALTVFLPKKVLAKVSA